jgi:hypothetical protein
VWALGLIVFYALTGRYFWPSLTGLRANFNVAALLVDIVVHPIPAPSARAAALGVGERLPPRFDAWFARCVTRDPAARFPDARAALDGLAPLLADARVTAPSDPALSATLPVSAPTAAPAPVFAPAPFAAPSAPAPALPVTSAPTPAAAPPRRWPLVAAVAALTVAGAVAVALRGATPSLPAPPRGPVAAARTPAPPPPDAAPSALADAAPARDAPTLDAPALDAPVAVGHLEVTCPRRCLVTVDGVAQAVARRPLALAPGDHAVVATHGAASLTRVVRVTAGETARVTFEFATDAAAHDAAAAPTARDATAPAPRDAAAAPAPRDAVAAPARDAAALPDRPDRAAVAATFRDVNAAARACGASGRVFVNADFAGDGHVIAASVEGPLSGTPTGECLARAVRQARVPPFRRATIRVSQALDL